MTTTSPPAVSTDELIALGPHLEMELARRDFLAFLRYCKVETEAGIRPMEVGAHFFDPQYSPQGVSFFDALLKGKDRVVVLKARQLWVSWFLAAFNLWEAMYKTPLLIQEFSMAEKEAQELLRKSKFIYDQLPEALQAELERRPSMTEMDFRNGGRLISFPATQRAGRSYTSRRSFFDENAFHEYARENYQAAEPQAGQIVQVSTANGENFFSRSFWALWNNEAPGVAIFYPWWVVRGNDEMPRYLDDRSPNHEWYDWKKAGYPGFEADFKAEFPATPLDAFESREGLVYAMFDDHKHVSTVHPWRWEDSKLRVAGVDPGGGDPTAIVELGVNGARHVHQFREHYWREPVSVETLGEQLILSGPWHRILVDPSQPLVVESLRGMGLPAEGADNRRGEGIPILAELLNQERFTIHTDCRESIKEFQGYRWKSQLDPNVKDRFATSAAIDHHADAMDARRYALMWILRTDIRPRTVIMNRSRRTHYV